MKTAFVFPGQGSQFLGMLDVWNDNHIIKDVISLASDVLDQDVNYLIKNGPLEDLNLTINTQPIMLAIGFAYFSFWKSFGRGMPILMAGHSLGEYTALVAAESILFEDALRLVRIRAEAMQSAVPIGFGAMAAIIGLNPETVISICRSSSINGCIVEAVNFNSPVQTVIAGHKDAVDKVCNEAKNSGAKKTVLLPVSAPFHSSLLKPAALTLSDFIDNVNFSVPKIDVINNVDVSIYRNPFEIKDALIRQVWKPVRWIEIINKMSALGITNIIEFGPGSVLSSFIKRIDSNLSVTSIKDPKSLDDSLNFFH
ncbi:ACP S-malonyltransferase [Candidatus Kinetoplastidibacterium crithidiae]|uniref:Malonyl CoA-acyl carrier protein transacylase n=1 Tax=Candidatus Kinetoplastidibacterium crithidiae TCC036E TaxID=1208918 RepID=M1LUI0_9PROT|nr:ACP S-malonyltransferase [Candidatus Kinetoplastibacterium crithidii]AFZ82592.1 [acyl-carrier-protein] S-malonyltransferase [Candidatus Kinetoplastibacterium crithidii (ex Angomonas deanei ATCC 30255)]AGF47746.1 [acyl-carrier-protein] S-malonyltransferase [Candidatus Kinetoplastibacterium crithidii TCC036E]